MYEKIVTSNQPRVGRFPNHSLLFIIMDVVFSRNAFFTFLFKAFISLSNSLRCLQSVRWPHAILQSKLSFYKSCHFLSFCSTNLMKARANWPKRFFFYKKSVLVQTEDECVLNLPNKNPTNQKELIPISVLLFALLFFTCISYQNGNFRYLAI